MKNQCAYCSGIGYFQLITGGSETCPSCLGTGSEEESITVEENEASQLQK
jgi:DnaJ-class molecular chaperone